LHFKFDTLQILDVIFLGCGFFSSSRSGATLIYRTRRNVTFRISHASWCTKHSCL